MKALCLVLAICVSVNAETTEEERWFNGFYGPNVFFGSNSKLGQHGGQGHQRPEVGHHHGHHRGHYRHYVNLEACECLQVIGNEVTEPVAETTTTAAAATTTAAMSTSAVWNDWTTATTAATTTAVWNDWTTASTTATTAAGGDWWSTAAGRRFIETNPIPTYDLPGLNTENRDALDFYNVNLARHGGHRQHNHRDHSDEVDDDSSAASSEQQYDENELHRHHHHKAQVHRKPHHHSISEEIIPDSAPFVAPAEYVPNSSDEYVRYRRQPGFRNPYTGECVCAQIGASTDAAATTGSTTEATTTTAATTTTTVAG